MKLLLLTVCTLLTLCYRSLLPLQSLFVAFVLFNYTGFKQIFLTCDIKPGMKSKLIKIQWT